MSDNVWLMLTGHHRAGKSWLFNSLQGTRNTGYQWTVGIDIMIKEFQISQERTVSVKIFDSPGHEKFETITTSAYFHKMSGFVLVFDVTDEDTFERYTFNKWHDYILKIGKRDVPVILVGTKCDLERQVSRERALAIADNLGIKYYEVNSVTRQNVDLAFETLVKDVFETNL